MTGVELTNGDPTVGTHQVDIRLGDGSHTDLVIGSGEESSECAGKSNGTVTGGAADGNSYLQQPGEIFKCISNSF